MPPEVSEGLSIVAECIQKSDREVIEEIEDEAQSGEQVRGFLFTHGDEQLAAITDEELNFFNVQFDYNIVNDVAAAWYIEEQVDEIPQNPGEELEINIQLEESDIHQAQEKVARINQSRDQDKTSQFEVKLIQLLSNPNCGFEILNRLNGPHGFQVTTKQFVYESDYQPSDFNDACQAIVSVGMYPREFLKQAFNIDINLGGSESGDQSGGLSPGSRGFQ